MTAFVTSSQVMWCCRSLQGMCSNNKGLPEDRRGLVFSTIIRPDCDWKRLNERNGRREVGRGGRREERKAGWAGLQLGHWGEGRF